MTPKSSLPLVMQARVLVAHSPPPAEDYVCQPPQQLNGPRD